MACEAQGNWSDNYYLREYQDYHRHFLLIVLEFSSLLAILVVAVVANFATIITISRTPSLKEKLGNMLIINLCVMDLITALGSMIFSLIDVVAEGYLLCVPVLCSIHGCLVVLGCFGNFAAILLIALHRFLQVVAVDKVTITKRHIWWMIAGCWTFSIGVWIPPLIGSSKSVYSHGTHHCSPAWARSCGYFVMCITAVYAMTLPIMIVCYSAIYWKVRKSGRRLERYQNVKTKKNSAVSSCQDDEMNNWGYQSDDRSVTDATRFDDVVMEQHFDGQAEPKIALEVDDERLGQPGTSSDSAEPMSVLGLPTLSDLDQKNVGASKSRGIATLTHNVTVDIRIALAGALLVITTFVCWTPYFAVNSCNRTTQSSHAVRILVMWLGYTNSALDPVIYTCLNVKLRKAIQEQLRHLWAFLTRIRR